MAVPLTRDGDLADGAVNWHFKIRLTGFAVHPTRHLIFTLVNGGCLASVPHPSAVGPVSIATASESRTRRGPYPKLSTIARVTDIEVIL